jgi:hypothetical protein
MVEIVAQQNKEWRDRQVEILTNLNSSRDTADVRGNWQSLDLILVRV